MNRSADVPPEPRVPLYGGFSESDLIEQPAIDLFGQLGWKTINLFGEFASGKSTEGRESRREVFLPIRLKSAIKTLNADLPESAIDEAYKVLVSERPHIEPVRASREVYELIKDGVKVKLRNATTGVICDETVRIIDWDDAGNNQFLLASQIWFAGDLYTRRADLVGFVNGIPLLLAEIKGIYRNLKDAYEKNITDYRATIPQVFVPCAAVLVSNGMDARLGSPLAPYEYFAEWKKVDDESELGVVSLETMIRAVGRPHRFLDIVENFIAFEEEKRGLVKKLAKNHQYLGVNRAIDAVMKLKENRGRLGVFWHTQGSGKSLSILFFACKVLRKLPGDWTFVIVTDRTELDDQIAGSFSACGVLGKERQHVQAQSRDHLKELLTGNERFVFTLIQKFGTERGEVYPVLSERSDIIIITDEAHRSQYDILAANMRQALPNASFLGFTGTPLIAGEEERTRDVFGDYVSVYDFAQSIIDGATVPLYYESRLPELQLKAADLEDEIARVLDEADLEEDVEERLAGRFGRQYQIITNDDRLDKIAQDLVRHFSARGYRGKAMFIAIDKATAVRMYDKVQQHWHAMLTRERERIAKVTDGMERAALQEKLNWFTSTDMAVVVSGSSQNEINLLAERDLDIRPHRQRMQQEDLDDKFKADDDPLRLVFVCAMWITGFDVPTCSTIYLDKPMKNHTLMQTIARANRVSPGKEAGLIVDYVGVFRNLKDALAIYARPRPGVDDLPIKDKAALVAEFSAALGKAAEWARERGVDIEAIIKAEGFQRQARIKEAAEAVLGHDEEKREFLRHTAHAWRLFKSMLPDPAALEHRWVMVALQVIAQTVCSLAQPEQKDISAVVAEIERLIDDAISGVAIRAPVPTGNDLKKLFDLSSMDFDKLADLFRQGSKKTATEVLRGQAERKARDLASRNPTRLSLLERLQALIDRCNTGSMDIEQMFEELLRFVRDLDEEERRHVREHLTEEELSIFDILTKPEPELSKTEEVAVKKIARQLLAKLTREKLILDWRNKEMAKAAVRETIREELDDLPEIYGRRLWEEKVERTYQFVFEHYEGAALHRPESAA
jgi:type I restriction enzyme R subunit